MQIRPLALGLVAVLLLAATGTALAGGHDQAAANKSAREERHAALHAAREAALASFRENRSEAAEAFHAAHNATKASFLENKTRIQAECAAQRNMTEGSDGAQNEEKCIRDALAPLIEKARAEHQAQRQAFKDAITAAKRSAMEMFMKARERAPREG